MSPQITETTPGIKEPVMSDADVNKWRADSAAQRAQAMQSIGHNALVNVQGGVATVEEAAHMMADEQDLVDPHATHASH